jgi:hypothetical protein
MLEQARALRLHLQESRGMTDGPIKTLPRPGRRQSHHPAHGDQGDPPATVLVLSVGPAAGAGASILGHANAMLLAWGVDAGVMVFPPRALMTPSAVLTTGIVVLVSDPPPRVS